MYAPQYALSIFRGRVDWDLSAEVMTILLDALVAIDLAIMRRHPLPPLYSGRVRYFAESNWEGPWLDAAVVAMVGAADCKSLTAYRVAELRLQGVDCRPEFRRTLYPDGTQQIHVFVRFADGRFEDPSQILGMPVG